MVRYLSMGGMFKSKNSSHTSTYGGINFDLGSYKKQDLIYNIRKNSHDNYEIEINLEDATLLGSEDSWDILNETVTNNYKLNFDYGQM